MILVPHLSILHMTRLTAISTASSTQLTTGSSRSSGTPYIRERRKDWVSRYVDVVINHNRNEEVLVLEDLRPMTSGLLEEVLKEAEGFPNYSRITGLILD
ncbi:hypothetical protein DDW10_04580 [Sulfolobales archaeon SCGC AB-777_J03]|nr:hypothetical protein DDW10_04580 [Sulfolobales archaeon SCGC AB-777_J03]